MMNGWIRPQRARSTRLESIPFLCSGVRLTPLRPLPLLPLLPHSNPLNPCACGLDDRMKSISGGGWTFTAHDLTALRSKWMDVSAHLTDSHANAHQQRPSPASFDQSVDRFMPWAVNL